MSRSLSVAVVGATGTTGSAIVAGLLGSSEINFTVISLARPSSVDKPAYRELESRGVKVISVDLRGSEDGISRALSSVDIIISAIVFTELDAEIALANAAKAAGVKRFLQSAFMVVIPPRGVVDFREQKEDTLNYIQKIRLPYTYLDAGWWYDIAVPKPPSQIEPNQPAGELGADGNVPMAIVNVRDIGRYVAKVIADPRTLNKRVFVYNEVYTQNQLYGLVESLTGKKLARSYVSKTESEARIKEAKIATVANPSSSEALGALVLSQLFHSVTIRGDNTPDNAKYLGYLDGKDLYPDFVYTTVEEYIKSRA